MRNRALLGLIALGCSDPGLSQLVEPTEGTPEHEQICERIVALECSDTTHSRCLSALRVSEGRARVGCQREFDEWLECAEGSEFVCVDERTWPEDCLSQVAALNRCEERVLDKLMSGE